MNTNPHPPRKERQQRFSRWEKLFLTVGGLAFILHLTAPLWIESEKIQVAILLVASAGIMPVFFKQGMTKSR